MVISSDEQIDFIVKMIQDDDSSFTYIKANYWQIVDPDNKKKYLSGYEYGLRNKHGRISNHGTRGTRPDFLDADDIKMTFIQKTANNALGSNCESLTKKHVCFEVTFTQGSMKYSKYKKSLGTRIVLTPLSVIVDVITSPIQLIAFLTVPLWGPH